MLTRTQCSLSNSRAISGVHHQTSEISCDDSASPRHQPVINLGHRATSGHIKTQQDTHASHMRCQHQRRSRPLTAYDAYMPLTAASVILEPFLMCANNQKSHNHSAHLANVSSCVNRAPTASATTQHRGNRAVFTCGRYMNRTVG